MKTYDGRKAERRKIGQGWHRIDFLFTFKIIKTCTQEADEFNIEKREQFLVVSILLVIVPR